MLTRLIVLFDRTVGRRFYRMHRSVYVLTGGLIGHRSPVGRFLLLTTTGRKSGARRTTPLLYMPDGACFVVVGSNAGRDQTPAWVLNLMADPAAQLQVGRRKLRSEAHFLSDDEKTVMWPRLLRCYRGWGDYQGLTHRQLRIVSFCPDVGAGAGAGAGAPTRPGPEG